MILGIVLVKNQHQKEIISILKLTNLNIHIYGLKIAFTLKSVLICTMFIHFLSIVIQPSPSP